MDRADVVVIGAGIVGLSTAYWLAKAGANVIVLDKGRAAWEASSRATGFLSLRGEQPLESPLAIEAEKLWNGLDAELGSPTEWKPSGRLWVARTEDEYRELQSTYQQFARTDIPFRLIDGQEARQIVPCLPTDVIGAIHTTRSGHANPQRTSQAFAWAFQALGGRLLEFTPAVGIDSAGGRITGVRTPAGVIASERVVNCAGPQAALIAAMIGVDLPLTALRLEAMVTAPLPPLFDVALVAGGLSLRQTRRGNIHFNGGPYEFIDVGLTTEPDKPSTPAVRNIARRLAELFPTLRNIHVIRSWSGVVEMTPDLVAVAEKVDAPQGMVIGVTSGHGFGLAPAFGKALAELALEGHTLMPVAGLGLQRFVQLDPHWKERRGWNPGSYSA